MGRRYKTVTIKVTLADALSSGHAELESLKDELTEWRDNLSDNNMDHLPKYDEVSEAADTLENAVDNFDPDDVISQLEEAGVDVGVEVDVSEDRPYGGKGAPRWMRCTNACAMLEAAESEARAQLEAIEEKQQAAEEKAEESENEDGEDTEDEEVSTDPVDFGILDPIEEFRGECENVSFPNMY